MIFKDTEEAKTFKATLLAYADHLEKHIIPQYDDKLVGWRNRQMIQNILKEEVVRMRRIAHKETMQMLVLEKVHKKWPQGCLVCGEEHGNGLPCPKITPAAGV